MQHSLIKNGKILGFLIEENNSFFLVGHKGSRVMELYNEVFNLVKTSFTLGSTIGALENIQIGYRNNDTQKYEISQIPKSHEIISLSGNISFKPNNILFPHLHVALSNDLCQVFGGHLVDATISITLEGQLFLLPFIMERKLDSNTGLDLISGIK